jgi:hypothetical protein
MEWSVSIDIKQIINWESCHIFLWVWHWACPDVSTWIEATRFRFQWLSPDISRLLHLAVNMARSFTILKPVICSLSHCSKSKYLPYRRISPFNKQLIPIRLTFHHRILKLHSRVNEKEKNRISTPTTAQKLTNVSTLTKLQSSYIFNPFCNVFNSIKSRDSSVICSMSNCNQWQFAAFVLSMTRFWLIEHSSAFLLNVNLVAVRAPPFQYLAWWYVRCPS